MHHALTANANTDETCGAERRVGISQRHYLDLFLQAEDFGPNMKLAQDTRLKGPDRADVWFPKYQGILTGLSLWIGSTGDPVWRLVDIRTVFPTEWQASAWNVDAREYNSERMPPVASAPTVGEECGVFGGTNASPLGPGLMLTSFFYLFRRGRVVVKLFVMQGVESAIPLTPAHVAKLALCIDDRIKRILGHPRAL